LTARWGFSTAKCSGAAAGECCRQKAARLFELPASEPPRPTIVSVFGTPLRFRLRSRRRVDAHDARGLVAENLITMRCPRGGDDDITCLGREGLVLDRPPHPAGAHDDDVILRRIMGVHRLDLPDGVRHEVDLDVVEQMPSSSLAGRSKRL
jgi:hypothetical protein